MNIVKAIQELANRIKSSGMTQAQVDQLDAAHSKIRALEAALEDLRANGSSNGPSNEVINAAVAAAVVGLVSQDALSTAVQTVARDFSASLTDEARLRTEADAALAAQIGDVGALPELPPLVP